MNRYVMICFGISAVFAASGFCDIDTGPTVILDYGQDQEALNDSEHFLYFVPVISKTLVGSQSSEDNQQTTRVVTYHRDNEDESFSVQCEFEMRGHGWYRQQFDADAMIAWQSEGMKGKELKNLLDFIALEGEGFGQIEVAGRVIDGRDIVDNVKIHFNARGCKSPVRAGLYSLKQKKGQYRYENRYDKMIVRINTLSFSRTKKTPKMIVSVASVVGAEEKEGLWGAIKGALANLVLSPVEIAEMGNQTMLDFGKALYQKQRTFTFPRAKNLIESATARAHAPRKET
ncbi:MAG: hypothetical protein JXA82_08630 [Sedimentisphaerales bacterium]|nr:hypothetical protein [Sedimentisphaerales bacterium]